MYFFYFIMVFYNNYHNLSIVILGNIIWHFNEALAIAGSLMIL